MTGTDYDRTCVSRWTSINLYSFRTSLRLLISSKAISMASGIPAPHHDFFPVIGAIEPMYKGLSWAVMLFNSAASSWLTTLIVARSASMTIHLVKVKFIFQMFMVRLIKPRRVRNVPVCRIINVLLILLWCCMNLQLRRFVPAGR